MSRRQLTHLDMQRAQTWLYRPSAGDDYAIERLLPVIAAHSGPILSSQFHYYAIDAIAVDGARAFTVCAAGTASENWLSACVVCWREPAECAAWQTTLRLARSVGAIAVVARPNDLPWIAAVRRRRQRQSSDNPATLKRAMTRLESYVAWATINAVDDGNPLRVHDTEGLDASGW